MARSDTAADPNDAPVYRLKHEPHGPTVYRECFESYGWINNIKVPEEGN